MAQRFSAWRVTLLLLVLLATSWAEGKGKKNSKRPRKASSIQLQPSPAQNSGQALTSTDSDSGPIVGGVSDADGTAADSLTAAQEAVKLLNAGAWPQLKAQLSIAGDISLVQIKAATKQVVAGSKYEIVMTITGPAAANANKAVVANIHVSVWVQLWMDPAYSLLDAEVVLE